MNFFEFSRKLRDVSRVKYPDGIADENAIRDMEDMLGLTTGSELELYLQNIGSVRRDSVYFLGLDSMTFATRMLQNSANLSGKYFVIEYKTSSELALLDQKDKIWFYSPFKSGLTGGNQDLFEYILFRFAEFDDSDDYTKHSCEIREWWASHAAIKSDIMHIIVYGFDMYFETSDIKDRVFDYLRANAGYLPCDAELFYHTYFDDFWPLFN